MRARQTLRVGGGMHRHSHGKRKARRKSQRQKRLIPTKIARRQVTNIERGLNAVKRHSSVLRRSQLKQIDERVVRLWPGEDEMCFVLLQEIGLAHLGCDQRKTDWTDASDFTFKLSWKRSCPALTSSSGTAAGAAFVENGKSNESMKRSLREN